MNQAAMTNYAIEQGIPESDIVQDYAGRRTYDTCYRAKEIFWTGISYRHHAAISPFPHGLPLRTVWAQHLWRSSKAV